MRRRRLVLSVTVIAAAALAVLLLVILTSPGHTARPRAAGAFAQAVSCARPGGSASVCPAADRISTLPSQAAVISGDGTEVLWFAADGHEWQTTIGSSAEATRIFTDNGFSNFRQDGSSPGSNLFLALLLPNLVLLSLLVLFCAIVVVAIVLSRRTPTMPT